jgi:DNA-binding SARP family transcriptional activator
MPGRLRFELLGPVRAARGDDVLELGSPQQCATLAVLLLNEGRQVSSADLVGALWSGEPPRSATGVVRTYVSRLRRVLDGVIESAGDGYALPPRDAVLDADHFQRLVAAAQQARQRADVAEVAALLHSALDLWRGEPMSGLRTPYFDAHRSRLVELKWTAIEDRLAADLELGRHAETVAELRSLVARHPTRERLHELLMLALYKCGRQGEALAAFQDARQRLAEQLGIEPGLALRRAHRLLVDVGQVSAGTPGKTVPNQLPPDVAEFVGRDEALRLIGLGRAVAITGMPGVGKSALAVHAAHRLGATYPDGRLYADLDGMSGRPADPHHVLGGFLRALGVADDAIPGSLGDRAGLWRTLSAERRLLVVLDNAGGAEQVRRLMPTPGHSGVIITSRRRLVELPAVEWIVLGRLDADAAVTLLERLIGRARVRREYESAVRLVARCAYHPLPIRLVAARLAARPFESVAQAEARLRTAALDHELVEAPAEAAYQLLDERQARVFRLGGLPEAPEISIAALSALVERPERELHETMESLIDVYLVSAVGPGRYTYDPMLKRYAQRKAMLVDGEAGARTAQASLLLFYLAGTFNALTLLDPGDPPPIMSGLGTGTTFRSREAACAWLLNEHEQVLASIEAAGDVLGDAVDVLGDLCWVAERLEAHRYEHTDDMATSLRA